MADLAKPYQIDGIIGLATRNRAFLFDDAGLGKSMQVIRAANALNLNRILIVGPAISRVSWEIQFATWDLHPRLFWVVRGNPDLSARLPHPDTHPRVVAFMSYTMAARLNWASVPFDVIVLDEAHKLKNPGAVSTQSVYGAGLNLAPQKGGSPPLASLAPIRWVLTATPTPLNASELYTHLRALSPDVLAEFFWDDRRDLRLPKYTAFRDRICVVRDGRFGLEIVGNRQSEVDKLMHLLRPHIIRRSKADVAADLGLIHAVELPLRVAVNPVTPVGLDRMSDDEVLNYLNQPTGDSPQGQPSPARVLGEAKAASAVSWLDDWLEANPGQKIVVFYRHLSVRDILRGWLTNTTVAYTGVSGDTPAAVRATNVALFQCVPNVRVFLGQIRAANTAITLTAASTVLIVEADPSPVENYQGISRCHRLGQTEPVTAYFATAANNALDRRHVQILRRRALDNKAMHGIDLTTI